jgi:hypothetical protein
MKKHVPLLMVLAGISLAQDIPSPVVPVAGPASGLTVDEAEKKPPTLVLETGAEATSVQGKKSFGFQAYRDVPQGPVINRFDYRLIREGNPLGFTFRSTDLLQRDMVFDGVLEDVGRFKIDLNFDSFSRYWSNRDQTTLVQSQPGFLAVSDAMRSAVEASMASLTPGTTCAAWSGCAIVGANVANSGQTEVRAYRQRGTVTQTYQLHDGLTLELNFMRERRSGDRLMSEGAYSRQDTPIGVVFEMPGQELWEPTDYRTTEFGAGLHYARKHWLANFEYTGSLFHDDLNSLTWENPMRITPAQATLNGDPYKDGAQGRFRFAETQSSLPPSNQAHTFTGSLMLLLPHSTRISALLSWARGSQNDAFLPFTINPAITIANSLKPINPGLVIPQIPSGVALTSLAALPQPSLHGLNHTLTQDYVATTRPIPPLQLTLHYNDYDFDDLTKQIVFPGYAAYGNSFWRTTRYGQPASNPQNPAQGDTDVLIERNAKSFQRQEVLLESVWKPVHDWTWKAAYRCDFYHRDNRQVRDLTDSGIVSSIAYAPRGPFYLQAGFTYMDRNPASYDPGYVENLYLRMFDETRRIRTQANALFTVDITPKVMLSGSWSYTGDSFDKQFYGLHQQKATSITTDISYSVNENFGFYAGWGYDRVGYDYLLSASLGYYLQNSWSRDTRDGVYSAQMGFSGSFLEGKVNYSFSYGMTLAHMRVNTVNPYAVQPDALDYSRAYPFPTVKSQLQELRAEASYRLSRPVRLGFSLYYEPYRLSDFAFDTLSPYDPSSFAPETDTRRYLFMGSGPSNYTGKLVSVFIRYSF